MSGVKGERFLVQAPTRTATRKNSMVIFTVLRIIFPLCFDVAKIGFSLKTGIFFAEKTQPIENCCTFAAEIWLSGR